MEGGKMHFHPINTGCLLFCQPEIKVNPSQGHKTPCTGMFFCHTNTQLLGSKNWKWNCSITCLQPWIQNMNCTWGRTRRPVSRWGAAAWCRAGRRAGSRSRRASRSSWCRRSGEWGRPRCSSTPPRPQSRWTRRGTCTGTGSSGGEKSVDCEQDFDLVPEGRCWGAYCWSLL